MAPTHRFWGETSMASPSMALMATLTLLILIVVSGG